MDRPSFQPCLHCGTTSDHSEIVAFVHATRQACLVTGQSFGPLRPCCWAQGLVNDRKLAAITAQLDALADRGPSPPSRRLPSRQFPYRLAERPPLPVLDDRTPEEICGYGDDGLCSH